MDPKRKEAWLGLVKKNFSNLQEVYTYKTYKEITKFQKLILKLIGIDLIKEDIYYEFEGVKRREYSFKQ